jgi:hypothetical protein
MHAVVFAHGVDAPESQFNDLKNPASIRVVFGVLG